MSSGAITMCSCLLYTSLFNWKSGKGTGGSEQKYAFNINCDVHAPLNDSGILEMLGDNNNFEIDSNCTKSNMLPKIQAKIEEDSLLKKGTWAYPVSYTHLDVYKRQVTGRRIHFLSVQLRWDFIRL